MSRSALDCGSCPVRDRAACSALSPDEREELARLGAHLKLKAGETLVYAGDDDAPCATLISGALKISSIDSDGTEHILSLIHPSGFIGELFAPAAHHDVVAIADSELCIFPGRRYVQMLDRFPQLARALHRRAAQDLVASRTLLGLVGRHSAKARVAGFMLAMGEAASHSPCHLAEHFSLPLSRGEIGGFLGMTIETVSRQFSSLERQGVIVREGARGIRLLDVRRLRDLADQA